MNENIETEFTSNSVLTSVSEYKSKSNIKNNSNNLNDNSDNVSNNVSNNNDTDTNIDTDTDTDSDEYVDLSEYIEDNLKHIFQFHINNEKLFLKYIGKSSDTPDIIIMENFGPETNMCLYNCVYSHQELESVKKFETNPESKIIIQSNHVNMDENMDENMEENMEQLRLFFPIIKLVVKETDNTIISSIAIKLEQEIVFDGIINEWSLYWVSNSNKSEYIKTLKLEKNINPTNILEQIIHYSLKNN